uniref:Aldo/keto reductase family protein n=1 Tax=Mimivirus LCMiAC01 TaxID=2506608 RepID=A0A481YZS8_9VIRU|nr:MAG: aldo/keto reductase family protein [Mimivirus LCMiAC01]
MDHVPIIGFGTYRLDNETTYKMVKEALKLGYRHIDTAQLYRNEESVGKAINDIINDKSNNIRREDIFITTKIWLSNIKNGRKGIIKSIMNSLAKLNVSYIDLLLIHKPVNKKVLESWSVLEDIYNGKIKGLNGNIKRIGVSNFNIKHLQIIMKSSNKCEHRERVPVKPYANQVEITPFCKQKEIVDFCEKNNIKIISHSSLTKGHMFHHILLNELEEKYKRSSAQILLKWAILKRYCVLPRTSNKEHLKENFNLNFCIDSKDIEKLDNINEFYSTHKIY